jgi:hypothetical protein
VDLGQAVREVDLVIVLQTHEEFVYSTEVTSAECVLDTSGHFSGDNVDRL